MVIQTSYGFITAGITDQELPSKRKYEAKYVLNMDE
jgi:hypothetical protein